jgi:hypothetical protein
MRTHWALRVSVVYALSRVLTTVLMFLHAATQPLTGNGAASVAYTSISNVWDAAWYQWVAYNGYPGELPVDSEGYVDENAWAFMPVYPYLVRVLATATGVGWEHMAVAVSVLAGWGAALMFHRLLAIRLGPGTSFFAVILFCVAPLSPVLQIGYAESLQLFLLATALYLLVRRRYGWMFPVIVVMGLTRPSGLAFALLLGLYWLYRLARRRSEPFPARENATVIGLGATSVATALLWPGLAALATGSLTAYTDTELSWRSAYIGPQHLIPFTPWFQGAEWWFGFPTGLLILILAVAAFVGLLVSPGMRRLGPEATLWCVAYALYLLAFFFPQSSTFRLLMPLFPLLAAFAAPRWMWYRVPLVALSIAGQWWWLQSCFHLGGSTWWVP